MIKQLKLLKCVFFPKKSLAASENLSLNSYKTYPCFSLKKILYCPLLIVFVKFFKCLKKFLLFYLNQRYDVLPTSGKLETFLLERPAYYYFIDSIRSLFPYMGSPLVDKILGR